MCAARFRWCNKRSRFRHRLICQRPEPVVPGNHRTNEDTNGPELPPRAAIREVAQTLRASFFEHAADWLEMEANQ